MKPEQKGVYSKLKDSSVSWSEKLSLARSAWDSPDCVIPNKQQILLDWIIQELIKEGRKAANSHASKEVCGLWKLLLHVCQSQQLVLHGRIPVILKPQLLQVFSDAFSHAFEESALEESFINAVISCCYTVVSTPQLASSLLAKFETYVTFLSSLLSFYIPICAGQSKEELHILVEVCLKKYLLVQRQQANQRKVFSAMCQHLLAPLTSLHHFLSAAQDQCRPNSWWTDKAQDILQLVKFALKRSLFHKDHIPEYQQALKVAREEKGTESEEPVIKKPRISTYAKLLFDKLWEVTVSSNSVTTVKGLDTEKIARKEAGLEILPFLYEEFVIAIRKLNPSTSAVEFDFFTEVCEMLGILNGACKDVASVCTLLYKLLECVHRYDIYQVADDSLNGSSQFNWLKNLLDVLIHTGVPCDSEAMFQCLDVFMKLNHCLLEPHLEIIWTMLWKAEKSGGASYNCLLSSLISTYVKLRQFEKLVLAILVSLRNLELSTRNFSALFQERFSTAIQGLPFGQIAGIWNIFNEEIKESYLNKLQSLSEQVLVKKSRKKKSSSNAVVVWKKLEYVMSVFHAFLLNISFGGIGEQSRRKSSVQSAGQLLRHTVQDVLEPLIELDNREIPYNEQESACFCTILLQYTLGELEIFLSKFQRFEDDKGTEILLPSVRWSAETGGFAPNKAKDATIINGDRGRLCYLKNALCIQSIRFMLLRNKKLVQEPGLYAEFQRLVSCVCSSVGDKVLSSTSWDTQVLTICEENAPVALWDLVSRNAVILLPPCNADQQLTLAQLLIKTVGEGTQANRHAIAGSITMSDVSETMIQSTAFHEMLAIQTCTVCALWGELKKSIHSTCSADGLGGRLSKLLQDIATPQFPKADNQNEEGICKNTVKDEDNIIDDEEENDNVGDDENAEGSSDNESNGEEDLGEEEETSQKQYVGSLSAFYAVGCELIRISNSALFSEDFEANLSGAECYRLLKVLGYLPLDWLSDDNHARCLIGLFTCDMVFTSVLLKQGSPDILKPLMLSRQLLTVMFDGCFSRKRFIPHHVIDLESVHAWLISSSTKLWQKFYKDPNISSGVLALLRVTRSLLYSTVKYLLKAPSKSTSNEHSTIEKLQDDLQTISKEVLQNSKHSVKKALSSHHAISIIIQGILAVCEEVLTSKTSSTKMIQISSDIVIKLGPTLLELLKAVMQASQTKRRGNKDQNSKEGSESKWHDMLLEFPVLIDSFKSLLHIFSVSEKSRKLQRVNEELKKCEWQSVFDVALAAVIHHLFGRNMTLPFSGNEIGTVHSSLHFLKVVCQSCSKVELHLPDDFHLRLLASGLHFLRLLELNTSKSAEGIENKEGTNASQRDLLETVMMDGRKDLESKDIAEDGYSLVVSLLERCDPVLLPELLEGLCDEITTKTVNKDSLDRLYVSLQVWFRLLSGRFAKERRKELRPKLPKVLFALQFLLKELKTSNLRILHLAIDLMAKILSLGKGMLLPHNALLVLHSGLMIRLDACGNSFPQLFESQYTLLSTLLFQHSEAVYGAVHVFITCVRNLLCFLIQSCDERMEIAPENGSKTKAAHLKPAALTQSAQRMARLYQEISSHKSTFSKYSPYMIADYIHSVQSVAIPSVIREALIPGVYCLLDICGEHELSLMHAVLEKGARELFHSLHADYTKYHKFKGKV